MLPSFKKSEPEASKPLFPSAAPSAPQSRPAAPLGTRTDRSAPSVIAADLLITGNLTSKGEVQIEGEVQGDINATHVIVGERARITGSILAEEVVVRGHVLGSVRGRRVMLQSSCHVEGDVFHQSLAIEQGAYFEGKSRRTADPLAEARPAEPTPSSATSFAAPAPAPEATV